MNFPILKNNQANLGKKHTSPQLFYESNKSERFILYIPTFMTVKRSLIDIFLITTKIL